MQKNTPARATTAVLAIAVILALSSCEQPIMPPDLGTPIKRGFMLMGTTPASKPVLCYSDDGDTWTPYTSITTSGNVIYPSSAAADSSGYWVVPFMHVTGNTSAFLLSNNGDDWFASADSGVTQESYFYYSSIATNGNGLWVCVGGNSNAPTNIVVYSTDNAWTWGKATSSQSTLTQWLRSVAWGVDRFIAVGFGNLMARSTDGNTWQVIGSPVTANAVSIASDDAGRWVAVGGTNIVSSTDGGDTWSPVYSGTCAHVAHDRVMGRWIAASSGQIAWSDNGTDWNLPSISPVIGESSYGLAGRNGTWVIVTNEHGLIFRSTDGGDTWAEAADSGRYPCLYSVAAMP
jgi:hypothetical protein